MIRRLLAFSLTMVLVTLTPMTAQAAEAELYAVEQAIDEDITITINGQTLTVCGAQGETLEVVSLTGRRMMKVQIESPAQRVELNIPKGCYILKVGKVVRKISVR